MQDVAEFDLRVIAKNASRAIHIHDRCDIVARPNEALDEVSPAEAEELQSEGCEPGRTGLRQRAMPAGIGV